MIMSKSVAFPPSIGLWNRSLLFFQVISLFRNGIWYASLTLRKRGSVHCTVCCCNWLMMKRHLVSLEYAVVHSSVVGSGFVNRERV